MRIGIDAHYLGSQAGGNETYVRNLLLGLRELAPPAQFVVFVHPDHGGDDPALNGFEVAALPVRSSYLRVPLALPWLARKHRLDLLHVNYTAPPWCPCPYVVTLHDAVMLRHPESLPFATRHRLRLMSPRTLRRAAGVFTVSEAMRAELASLYGLSPAAITVTPNALGDAFRNAPSPGQCETVRRRYNLPEQYVLSLGRSSRARIYRGWPKHLPGWMPRTFPIPLWSPVRRLGSLAIWCKTLRNSSTAAASFSRAMWTMSIFPRSIRWPRRLRLCRYTKGLGFR